jgi:hypothetical protein
MTLNFVNLFLLSSLFVFVSCGQKGSNVKLEISHNFAFGNSAALQTVSGGGLMVWGKSSTGDAFAQTLEGSDDLNLQLTAGSWTFFAMAWDGSKDFLNAAATNSIFGGVARCAKSTPVALNGSPVSVDLTLNNNTCTDTAFAGSVATTTASGNVVLPPTRFTFCRGINQITDGTHLCTDTKNEPRQKERKAWIGSYKVKMKNFKVIAGAKTEGTSLSSSCVEMVGDPENTPTAGDIAQNYGGSSTKIHSLPAGGPGMPFHIELEMFPGNSDCDSSTGIRGSIVRQFPSGIVSDFPISNKYFTTPTDHKQYINVPSEVICNGRIATNIGDHPFAAGNGSQEHPYILCSVPQFHAINNSSTNMGLHYKQEANLDFNPYSSGLAGTGIVPTQFACLDSGANFIPLGYYATTCAGPGSALSWGTLQNFTGTYSGGGYKISNLRLRDKNKNQLGIFASINGNAEVGNLIIENVEIEGKDTVGLLAGIGQGASNASSMTFWNINAFKLDIQARDENMAESMVGGIFGRLDNASLAKVSIKDSQVRGVASKIGGVIGYGTNVNLKEVSAEVNIDGNSSVNSKFYVGGLVGQAEDMQMDLVKHEGAIYTNAKKVGGIAGAALNTTSLTNFYTFSHVSTNDSSTNLYLGGVVGYWGSVAGVNVGPGYSLSIVKSECTTACAEGPLAGYVQTQPSTQGGLYALPSSETGVSGSPGAFSSETQVGTLPGMRMTSGLTGLPNAGLGNWNHINGEYPRFDFENHPCTQISGSGVGTLVSPKIVCNEDQYLNLANVAGGTYHRLAGNIRLSQTNTSQYDIPTFAATLDGTNHMLLGGHSIVSGVSPVGHIGTITATAVIKNLQVHGMGRESNDSTTSLSNPHGGFAAINNGKIYNSQFSTYSKYTRNGSAFIGINSSGAEIKNVKVNGKLEGFYEGFAPFAVVNNGLIEASKTNTEMVCVEGAGCDYFAGLVVQNNGTIKRTEMAARLQQMGGNPANNASMLVDANTGLIEDVVVPDHAKFQVSSSPHYFHRTNSATGTLRRVINNGILASDNTNFSPSLSGYPTITSAVSPDLGIHTDVFRRGGRSGKLLLENVPFACTTADRVDISAWAGMSDYSSWNSAFLSSGYASDGRKIILELEFGGGRSTERGLTYDSANNGFTVTATRCYSGAVGTVSVWYTDDLAIDLSGNATSGTRVLQQSKYYSNYSTAFKAVMWDWNTPAHEQQKLSYYAFFLGISSTPVVPRIWELEDNGEQRLFEID